MPQLTVHRNRNPQSLAAVPFLLDVQHDLLSDLETRVVIPLRPVSAMQGKPLKRLMPVLEIEGERFILLTPQMAGIPKSELGTPVTRVEHYRSEIIAAIDFLLTGL
jgi:toxin CcdB